MTSIDRSAPLTQEQQTTIVIGSNEALDGAKRFLSSPLADRITQLQERAGDMYATEGEWTVPATGETLTYEARQTPITQGEAHDILVTAYQAVEDTGAKKAINGVLDELGFTRPVAAAAYRRV